MKKYSTFLFLFFICIIVTYSQNRVESLKLLGNRKTKSSFIEKISRIKSGTLLDSLIIEEDIQRLIRLPSVSFARYEVIPVGDAKYDVLYKIEENFTLIPSFNIYATQNEELAFRIGLGEYNLFGQNFTLRGFYQRDIYNSYGVTFRAPFLFSNRWGIATTHQNFTTQEPLYFQNFDAIYRYNNTSFEVLGLFQHSFQHRIEFGINLFRESYEYLKGAPENASFTRSKNLEKTLFKGVYEYNNLKFYYQYREGVKNIFLLQHITYEGFSKNFNVGWNDFFYYRRIGKRGNWANRLRVGLSSNDDGPFAPFVVDNNINIRGVGLAIDRGTAVITLNTEYLYTVIEGKTIALQSNVFMDIGTWRTAGGEFSDLISKKNILMYSGVGLRIIHKKIFGAVFRIDYGFGLLKNSNSRGIVFGVGQYF